MKKIILSLILIFACLVMAISINNKAVDARIDINTIDTVENSQVVGKAEGYLEPSFNTLRISEIKESNTTLKLPDGKKFIKIYSATIYDDGNVLNYFADFREATTIKISVKYDCSKATILYINDAKFLTKDVEAVNGYITFETDDYSQFAIIGDEDGSLVWLIVILSILLALALIAMCCLLKKVYCKKKTRSVVPLFLLLAVPGGQVAAVIILAILLVLAIVYDLFLYFFNGKIDLLLKKFEKKEVAQEVIKEQPKIVEKKVEQPKQEVIQDIEEEKDIVDINDRFRQVEEQGQTITYRYNKSLTARIMLLPDEMKKFFIELCNYLSQYKKVTYRMSWPNLTFKIGRKQVAKFSIRGKSIYLYLAIDANEVGAKYHCKDASMKKRYAEVPCMIKIKSERKFIYAKELIDLVCGKLGLTKVEKELEFKVADFPVDTIDNLLERKLVKLIRIGAGPINLENIKDEDDDDDEEESDTKELEVNGKKVFVRYNKSFTAKLILAEENIKDYYVELANYILSFKGVNHRMSWPNSSFNKGRTKVAKFGLRGKALYLYLPLVAAEQDAKFHCIDVSSKKKYADIPCLIKIKSDRKLGYAKQLIFDALTKLGLVCVVGKESTIFKADYPVDTVNNLIDRKLIKVNALNGEEITEDSILVAAKFNTQKSVTVEEAKKLVTDDVAKKLVVKKQVEKIIVGKKAIVNIDTLSENFNDGDVVTIKELKEKGIIGKNETAIKVLARGTLDKALTIEANAFSFDAIKMIAITGGKAIEL